MIKRIFLLIVTGVVIIIVGAFIILIKPTNPVIETEFFSLGMEICYDCNLPTAAQLMAIEPPTPEN